MHGAGHDRPVGAAVSLAYYVDEHGFFRYAPHRSAWLHYRPKTGEGAVQFRRALQALEIGVVYAHSPQATDEIVKPPASTGGGCAVP